ncbi:hypothetical protein A2841_01005 [Candidatus Kaiserbacteria bacterium RIFCSPHIGHO2_01_FULL_48_10]|uniref:Uncharacterized protein n=1 Tax=Candidatus Kaiserbacteria bacterium RIFCSPHIGHO2_01_FULL_48_10 TaxID=1798476 RepID=A0A1F6C5I2_9BACT|nr:MAG: hypothetical protein A2841_01005 [Candidatus Kaiserbacteria bacterium RIFCSPHIGHO2_01_FULL_48_10]
MKFILLALALILCAGAALGFSFVLGEIYLSLSTIATTRGQVAAVEQQETLTRTAQLFASETGELQKELDAFIAHDADVVKAIETIELAAQREKVELAIASVAVGSVGTWKRHEPVRAVMSAKGSFASLAAFATALETLPRVARVEKFGIETTGTEWFGTFEVSFVKEKITPP